MSVIVKKKLCWNCDGRVSASEENCSYCGVYLSAALSDSGSNSHLFSPPYRIEEAEQELSIPPSPFIGDSKFSENEGDLNKETFEEEHVNYNQNPNTVSDSVKKVIIPLALLLSGSIFFLFSLALFLFSQNGVFTLKWDGDYWFVYLIFSFLMLGIGWKFLNQINEEN